MQFFVYPIFRSQNIAGLLHGVLANVTALCSMVPGFESWSVLLGLRKFTYHKRVSHCYIKSKLIFIFVLKTSYIGSLFTQRPNCVLNRLASWDEFGHQRVFGLTGTRSSSLWNSAGSSGVSGGSVLSVAIILVFIRAGKNKTTALAVLKHL